MESIQQQLQIKISNSISDYNTDNPEIANIVRPKASTVKTKLDTSALFHSWTKDHVLTL